MPLRRYTDRQLLYIVTTFQAVGFIMIIWLGWYTVARWRAYDKIVKTNSENIKQIVDSLHEVGIRPETIPISKELP